MMATLSGFCQKAPDHGGVRWRTCSPGHVLWALARGRVRVASKLDLTPIDETGGLEDVWCRT